MATASPESGRTRRPSRTPEEWSEIAKNEIVPLLQQGTTMTEIRQRYGQGHTIRAALARIGYNTKGQKLEVAEVKGSRPKVLAKRVADRRHEGAAWWLLELETGKTEAELKELLTEQGYADVASGRVLKEKADAAE